MIFATATILVASGGMGVAAASAGTPEPPPATPTATDPGTPTPTDTASPTGSPTTSPTGDPTDLPTAPPVPTPSPTTPPQVPPLGPWAFLGTPHGEFVVATKDACVFVTVFTQTGEATVVAEDSITVRSQDGFEKVYAIDDTTRTFAGSRGNGEIQQGDWVSVSSASGTEQATAAYVYDLTRPIRNLWRGKDWWYTKQWKWRPGGSAKWRTPKPCPTPSIPPVPTPTATPTVPPTVTPTVTPPPTDLPTGTPTGTPTDVPTTPAPTPTGSETPSPTPTP
ncbi:hypothetical protein DQ384_27670 [Sphaerisporangium album]|uniref:Uncharacterized protein n=1 Tax=Sphaerisporangium album TaxID=509200 RepID=A0A367FBH8_9ACTN|nr:hypothetical protein DQ384_27670 [Sphaerisporangium album]